jgi:uncharacterized protein
MPEKCPRCAKEIEPENNPFRPFCSDRCKLIDLGFWISGTYRIPVLSEDEDSGRDSECRKNSDQE